MVSMEFTPATAFQPATFGPVNTDPVSGQQQAPPPPQPEAQFPADKVQVSATASGMQKQQKEIDAKPEVRIQLVEAINKKIKFNGYPFKSDFYKSVERLLKTAA